MSPLWFLVVVVPLAAVAGWYGRGSKPDRWLTALLAAIGVYSALRLLWAHDYAWAVFVAVGALVVALRSSRRLPDEAGDGDREREADGDRERGDGGGHGEARPNRPGPFR